MLGVFALNPLGLHGGVLQMLNHGLSTGGLFAVVGMLYERYHTRQIGDFGGIARRLPLLATFMVLLTLSSIGLPGLNGFAGEFLLLLGMFQRAWTSSPQFLVIAVLAVSGVVLGAWYMLQLVARVFFGPLREPHVEHGGGGAAAVSDLSWREIFALAPLVIPIFWIGLWPGFFLDRMRPALDRIPLAPAAVATNDYHGESNPKRQRGDTSPKRELGDAFTAGSPRWTGVGLEGLFHLLAPKGRAAIAQGAALGPVRARASQPQRGALPGSKRPVLLRSAPFRGFSIVVVRRGPGAAPRAIAARPFGAGRRGAGLGPGRKSPEGQFLPNHPDPCCGSPSPPAPLPQGERGGSCIAPFPQGETIAWSGGRPRD